MVNHKFIIKNGELRLGLSFKDKDIEICLYRGMDRIDAQLLTLNQNLDKLLIASIDKMSRRNSIDRLSLKTLKLPDKLDDEMVLTMIVKTIRGALSI